MVSFTETFERIKDETDLKNLADLARFIRTTRSYISRVKKKDEFPINWGFLVAQKYNLSTDWVLTGNGPKRLTNIENNKNEHHCKSEKERILNCIDEWLTELIEKDPRRTSWFECFLEDNVPEYKEWLTNNKAKKDQLMAMKEEEEFVECGWNWEAKRRFKIKTGEIYIVDPLNPRAKKYRGERVKLITHSQYDRKVEVLRVESEWHVKRNCFTEMDICDLRPEKKELELPIEQKKGR